jgi:hypothetical protein
MVVPDGLPVPAGGDRFLAKAFAGLRSEYREIVQLLTPILQMRKR